MDINNLELPSNRKFGLFFRRGIKTSPEKVLRIGLISVRICLPVVANSPKIIPSLTYWLFLL